MKAITIKQPFASLIIKGYKEYEFRTWATKYRGEILIHAGKSIDKKYLKIFGTEYNLDDMPLGVILGKVTITDCVKVDERLVDFLENKDSKVYSDFDGWDGYGFKIEDIIEFDVKPEAKGQLGIWNYEI